MSINIGTLDIGVAFAGDTAGLQKATADAQQGIDRFGASTSKAMRQVREDTKGAEDALGRLSQGFKGAVIGSSVAVGLIKLKNTAVEVGDALIQAQVQLDKLNNGFKFGAGGSAGGARELSFVREEANRLGLELGGAATQYMKMVAAARGTNMEGAKTRELFTSIAEASTVMGMSGEQSERAMQAVVQMMSKGKVQAEELRGQLGEHLPGAFAIAARAMGVTEVELNKLMETGQLVASDFLPKFGSQIRKEMAGSVEDASKSMQASLNRLETAWLTFKQNVSEQGAGDVIRGQLNYWAGALNNINELQQQAKASGGGFFAQDFAQFKGIVAAVNPMNVLTQSALDLNGRLGEAKDKLNDLEKQRPYSGNIFLGPAIEETKQLIAELERAKAARDQLARQPGTGASESRYSAMAEAEAIKAQQAKGLAYAKLMGDMATPQEKLTAAIFNAKKELGELYGPEVEARLREHFIKPTREAKKEVDDFTKAAMRGEKLFGDLTATDGGLSGDFSEKWGDLSAAYAKTYINAEQLLAAQAALLKLQPFYKKGLDEEKEAAKEQAKATAEAAKAYDAYYDAVQKNTDTLQGNIQSENDAAAAIGLSAIAIAELEAVKLQDMATSKERAALTWESIDLSGEMTAQLRAEAKALRDLAAAKVNRAVKETAADEAKQAADAWRKASEKIEQDLTDALMRGFESGKGFAENLRDTVANMFKTLVLRPVVQATVQGGLNAIGLGGGAGGALGTVSNGLSLYNAGSSALNWLGLGASAGTGIAATAGTGISLAASTGTGLGLTAGGTGLGLTGTAASGATLGSGLAAGSGAAAGGAAASIMSAIPYIGAFVAVAALIKSLDDSGTMHTGGLGSYSASGGSAVGDAVKGQGLGFDLASADYQSSTQQASAQMAQAVVGLLDSTAQTFGQKAGYFAATAFADDTSKDGAWGALMVKLGDQVLLDWKQGTDKWPGREFADGEAGAKEYAAAVAKDVRDYLITQTPDWADTMLSALGDAPTLESLSAVVQQINAAATALDGMGKASAAFASLSEQATSALITAMGGAETAVSSLSGYYANFYTESERAALATQQLTGQLADLGVALPASREAFRTLVEDTLAAGNTELAAQLLTLSGAFANVVPAAQDAATAIDNTAADLARAAERIAQERSGLERQLLQVTGNTAGLRALDLAALDASNRGIQEQIWAYQDQQAAQEAAAAAAQEAAQAAQEAANAYANAFNDAQQFLDGLRNTITGWLAQQNAQAGGMQGYNSAAASFSSQLTLARGGDRDALGGITSYASTLMDAIQRESSTASEAALRAGRVRGQLAALPAQVRPEQLIANAIAQWGGNTVNAVASGAASQVAEIKTLAAGYATALQPVVSGLSQGFAALDTNLSNALDLDEFSAALQGKATDAEIRRLFDMIDQDNDRLISASEATLAAAGTFGNQVAASLPRDFGKIDVDLSGGINFGEFTSAFAGLATESTLQATFAAIDTNGDGIITELEASVAATEALGIMITSSLATNFAKFDTSGNGTVDFSEFSGSLGGLASEATLRALFDKTDANGDGQISRLEAINANTTATAVDTSNNVVPTLRDINTGLGYHFGNLWYGLHTDLSAISGQLATGIKVTSLNQSAGSPVAFAQGGVFSNSIVNTPTRFNMGLMGEAGPEAIMPLSRTSSGDLGVQVQMPDWSQYGRGDSNNNAALVAEIRALREDNQAQARALVQMQNRMTKVLERWDGNGIPEERVTA